MHALHLPAFSSLAERRLFENLILYQHCPSLQFIYKTVPVYVPACFSALNINRSIDWLIYEIQAPSSDHLVNYTLFTFYINRVIEIIILTMRKFSFLNKNAQYFSLL